MSQEAASHGNHLLNSDSDSGGTTGDEKQLARETPPGSTSINTSVEKNQPLGMAMVGGKRGRRAKSTGSAGAGESEHETHIWTERERRKKMRNMFSTLHALLPQLPPKADKSTIVDEAVNYIKTLQNSLVKLQKKKHEIRQSASTAAAVDCEQSVITSHQQVLADHHPHHHHHPDTKQTCSVAADDGYSWIKPNLFSSSSAVPTSSPQLMCFQTWFSPNVVVSLCGNEAHISVCSPRKPGLLPTIFYILEKHKLEVLSAHISSTHHRSIYMIHAHHGGGVSDDDDDEFRIKGLGLGAEEVFKLAVGEMALCLSSSCQFQYNTTN